MELVYEPYMRALLGTAADFCEVLVFKLRTLSTAFSPSAEKILHPVATQGALRVVSRLNHRVSKGPYPEYSRANFHHWSPFPPERARPGPGPHTLAPAFFSVCGGVGRNFCTQALPKGHYRDTSLIRKRPPPRTTAGPQT